MYAENYRFTCYRKSGNHHSRKFSYKINSICDIYMDRPNGENILPVNISVQQIIKYGALHVDAVTVFVVSTLSGSEASIVVA